MSSASENGIASWSCAKISSCSDGIAPPSPSLTHANGHELRTGAEHHEMVGDLLAATLAELRLGQIDDLQVTQVRQSVDLEVLQGIHRGIQLPELWKGLHGEK